MSLFDYFRFGFAQAAPRKPEDALLDAIADGDVSLVRDIIAKSPHLAAPVYTEDGPDSPLSFAATYGRAEICDVLIAAGAEVDARGFYGQTALFNAVNSFIQGQGTLNPDPAFKFDPSDHEATIKLLIKHGADINTVNRNGQAPLDRCVLGFVDIAAFLIDNGADMERKNQYGETILMSAARSKSERVVAMLLDKGADPLAINNAGKTALDIARESESFTHNYKHAETVGLLKAATAVPVVTWMNAPQRPKP